MPRRSKWRVSKRCADCPFDTSGPGAELRRSLGRKRWADITRALRNDSHFLCHKTTESTGDGSNLVCAGSIEWSEANGVSQNYVRICERLDWAREQKRRA